MSGNRDDAHGGQGQPKRKDLRLLIKTTWADVHHSRIQEWSALGVVTGSHFGLFSLMRFLHELSQKGGIAFATTLPWVSLLGVAFCVLGALFTFRVRELITLQMGWIRDCEERLGLIGKPGSVIGSPEGLRGGRLLVKDYLRLPPLLSGSGLIFLFYVVLALSDVLSLFVLRGT